MRGKLAVECKYLGALVALLLVGVGGCASQRDGQLTQQQRDQISSEVKAAADGIVAKLEKLDAVGSFQSYADSPDWVMVNADGSRWDYQTTQKAWLDLPNAATAYQWTTTRQDFQVLSNDLVICTWAGKDETRLKSGEKVTYDPHTYTLVFRKIADQWKVVYSQDSGVPVTQKPATNK